MSKRVHVCATAASLHTWCAALSWKQHVHVLPGVVDVIASVGCACRTAIVVLHCRAHCCLYVRAGR